MMKAIETEYAGCLFRSRLEARWAVFFDALGIRWEYEPEGFEVDGDRYLPDFFLPGMGSWCDVGSHWGNPPTHGEGIFVEVKGDTHVSIDYLQMLYRMVAAGHLCRGVLLLGPIPDESNDVVVHGAFALAGAGAFDRDRNKIAEHWLCFTRYPHVLQSPKFREPWRPCWDDVQIDEPIDPVVATAYRAARSARFEHGQSGRML